jgi:hypothetical protein
MRVAIMALCGTLLWPAASATTYLVRPDGTGDFPTIQAAISVAADGDTMELTDGIFRGPGNRDIDYLGKAITVRSRGGNPEFCRIDCEGSAEQPHRAVNFVTGEGPGSILEGVTIANGYEVVYAGGIRFGGSAPTIRNCILRSNFADSGGATHSWSATPTLESCTLIDNHARFGAGMYLYYATARFLGCTFCANAATAFGSATYLTEYSTVALENTIIAFGLDGRPVGCSYPGTSATAICCDVYGNADGDWVDCLEGQLGTDGNICEDPIFCDASGGDLRLQEMSPCAAENNPLCGQIGAWPVGCGASGAPSQSNAIRSLSIGPCIANPFMGGTTIAYRLGPNSSADGAWLAIYDVAGRLVRTLHTPGVSGELRWDGTDDAGRALPGGIYLLRLAGGGRMVTERVVKIR